MSKENKKTVEFKSKNGSIDSRDLEEVTTRAACESGTAIYSFGNNHSLVVSAAGDRYHIFQRVRDELTSREVVVDVANFKFQKDALASCKKIERDIKNAVLKETIKEVEREANNLVAEIRSGQERMNFDE